MTGQKLFNLFFRHSTILAYVAIGAPSVPGGDTGLENDDFQEKIIGLKRSFLKSGTSVAVMVPHSQLFWFVKS